MTKCHLKFHYPQLADLYGTIGSKYISRLMLISLFPIIFLNFPMAVFTATITILTQPNCRIRYSETRPLPHLYLFLSSIEVNKKKKGVKFSNKSMVLFQGNRLGCIACTVSMLTNVMRSLGRNIVKTI